MAFCTAGTFRLLSRVDADHWMMRSLARKVAVVSAVALAMLAASVLEAWLWSLAYLGVGALESAEDQGGR